MMKNTVTATFNSAFDGANKRIMAFVTAGVIAIMGMAAVIAPAAGASATYTKAYSTMRACQTNQRSTGHNSSVRITQTCYSYQFDCNGNSCHYGYAFEYKYV